MISASQDKKDMDKEGTPFKYEDRPNVIVGELGIMKEGHNLDDIKQAEKRQIEKQQVIFIGIRGHESRILIFISRSQRLFSIINRVFNE